MIRILKKFNQLFDKGQKLQICIIILLMFIGALFETLGVSMIIPLMSAILDPNILENNAVIQDICNALNIEQQRTFILYVIGLLIFIFFIKNFFMLFQYFIQYRFVCNNRRKTQSKLLKAFLNRPYEYSICKSSGEIMQMLGENVTGTFNLLLKTITFFTESTIAIAILITIIITDPLMAIMTIVLLGTAMLISGRIIKGILKRAATTMIAKNTQANKWILQAVSGIKEIKVGFRESYFEQQYTKHAKEAVEMERKRLVLDSIPKLLLEFVCITSMLSIIALMIYIGRDLNTLMPQLTAIAVAATRLLPCTNRISTAWNGTSFNEPMLDKLLEHLQSIEQKSEHNEHSLTDRKNNSSCKKLTLRNSCGLYDVTYKYTNTESPVLMNVTMEIPVGTSIGIVGESGAGKTTVVDILLGLLIPQKGEVLCDGVNIQCNHQQWLSQIGYIPQMIYMLDDTIRANILFGRDDSRTVSDNKIWEALEEAQLADFVNTLPQKLDTEIGERGIKLSGGQRQRIGIARALYAKPKLLIFDEATSALDNETEAAVMESINKLHGKNTLVIIAHRLSTIQHCDSVYRVIDRHIVKEK